MARGFVLALAVVVIIMAPAVGRMGVSLEVLDDTIEPRPPAVPRQPAPRRAGTSTKRASAQSSDHQMPAGSVIGVRLRTTVGSATSAVGDQVDAALADAVSRDGIVLIPAGSMLRGSVVDVLPASDREPRGRVAVSFFVMEHATTRSRAAIRTRTIAVDAPQPAGKRRSDVQLIAGQPLNLILTEPLVIRPPR